MIELAYGSVKYYFLKATVDDFKEHYKQLSSNEVLQDAMTIVERYPLRSAIKKAIIEIASEDIDLFMVISTVDGILNFDQEVGLPSKQVRRWPQKEADFILACYEDPSEAVVPLSRQDLLDKIRSCSKATFCKIIRYLCIHDEITDKLSMAVTIALIKRLQHIIKDQRLFYSILTNSVLLSSSTIIAYYCYEDDDDEDDDG